MVRLEGEPKLCLERTASSFAGDLSEIVVKAASSIGQANRICWRRMVENVESVHPKLNGFRLGDPERLAHISVECPARERLHGEASQIALSAWGGILQKRNPKPALRHLNRTGCSGGDNFGQTLQRTAGSQIVLRCHAQALRILVRRVLGISKEIPGLPVPFHATLRIVPGPNDVGAPVGIQHVVSAKETARRSR